jgi:hypothetical protein
MHYLAASSALQAHYLTVAQTAQPPLLALLGKLPYLLAVSLAKEQECLALAVAVDFQSADHMVTLVMTEEPFGVLVTGEMYDMK